MGASVAYHLAQKGVTDVVLLEQETLGSGSTSKSAGGIRAQFADELNVRIALRSMAEFQALERVSGIGYKQARLPLPARRTRSTSRASRPRSSSSARSASRRELISPDDVKAMIPALETSDLLAARPTARSTATPRPRRSCRPTPGAAATRASRIRQGDVARRGSPCSGTRSSASRPPTGGSDADTSSARRASGRARSATLAGLDMPVRRRAALDALHARGRRPAGASCRSRSTSRPASTSTARGPASSSAGASRRSRAWPSHGDAPAAGARRAADPVVLVGLLRDEPRPQRASSARRTEPRRFLYATGFSGHGFQQARPSASTSPS